MGTELQVPDWLQSMIESQQAPSGAEQLISAVSSVPRISLKGQKFRFIEGGEEVRRETDKVHLIILGVQPENNMAKTYYEGDYSGDNEPPTCSSSDGVKPDSWVTAKQSDLCATCQWNKWGSAKSRSGGKAKKCRDSKRLMVVDPKDVENGTIYILNVTVASLKNLSNYGKSLAAKQVPLQAVITTVTMDEEADIPILHFDAAGIMKQEPTMKAIARASKKEWDNEEYAALDAPEQRRAPAITDQSSAPAAQTAPPEPQTKKEDTVAAPETPSSSGDEDIEDLLNKW